MTATGTADFAEITQLTADEVARLRRQLYGKAEIEAAEAELLFELDDRLGDEAAPEWAEFFVEALTDYLVDQTEPRGYVSDANADWLLARIAPTGRVEAGTGLELLIRVIEQAKSSPAALAGFALDQVAVGVVHGQGFVGHARELELGVIGETEVSLIRRILYAFGGHGCVGITRREAEVLFDINDMTAEAENDPAWSDLFVKAVASFLLVSSGYRPPCWSTDCAACWRATPRPTAATPAHTAGSARSARRATPTSTGCPSVSAATAACTTTRSR
mgnify:CR=1 FL=1